MRLPISFRLGLSSLFGFTSVLSVFVTLAACGSSDAPPGGTTPPTSPVDGGPSGDGGASPVDGSAPPDSSDGAAPPDGGQPDAAPSHARAHAGGLPSAIALANHLAFVTVGPRLAIWDLTAPAAPVLRGETEPFAGQLMGVAVMGTHAYVLQSANTDGLIFVVDVADPSAPKVGASIRLAAAGAPTSPMGAVADATHLYVADQEHGVSVLDLTAPATPALVKTLPLPGVTSVQIVGTRLYAVARGFTDDLGVEAYDLSAGLADLGSASFTGAASVAITPANVALATGINGQQALDLTDLAKPKTLTMAGSTPNALSVAAGADGVWIPAFDGLYAVDLSKPGTATIGPRIDLRTQGAQAVSVDGALFGLVTDRGRLLSIDVSTPSAPVGKATTDITLCADCGGMGIVGDDLAIADHAGGLRTGHLSDLAALGRGDLVTDLDFEDVAVAGGKAYVADWFFGARVYDVSMPSAPAALASLQTGGSPAAVAVEDGRIYVGESTNGGALRVIDVSDPSKPAELGSATTTFTLALEVRNKTVFVADSTFGGSSGGLHIFDAADPKAIKQVGSYADCGDVYDVALDGNTAVVACENGWDVVDITNVAAPKKLGHVDVKSPNAATAVAIAGSRAYLGHSAGVVVIDVSQPAQPKTVTERATSYEVRDLRVTTPGHLVAACGSGGMYQWDIP